MYHVYPWDKENEWQAYNFDAGVAESVVLKLFAQKCTQGFLWQASDQQELATVGSGNSHENLAD